MATRKVTVNLPEDQVEFLQKLARKEDLAFTTVLRRAINSEKFFVKQEEAGNKVLIEEPDRSIRQVMRK